MLHFNLLPNSYIAKVIHRVRQQLSVKGRVVCCVLMSAKVPACC